MVPPLLLLRVRWQDARLNPGVAKAVCQGSTLDDGDGNSKQTLTMMINRRRIGTRCHNDRVVGEENDEKAFIFVE